MEESLSDICSKLWELDKNRFEKGRDYKINLKDSGKGAKLFSYVDVKKLANTPTYQAFLQLLDNYESETSVPEEVTAGKINKSRAFLNRCLETDVMKKAHSFLLSKGLAPQGYKKAFKEKLYDLWFELHSRKGQDGTRRDVSAFEHTFVGETCGGQVIGFHNWVQLYEEERQGCLRYKRCKPQACDDRIITIDFTWDNNNKTFGSFFLGTSPEFELAIYTVCFLARPKKSNPETLVILGNKRAHIITKPVKSCEDHIGTCYPKLPEAFPPIQGRIQIPRSHDVHIPIDSEDDEELEDQPEKIRVIIPKNQLPSRNGEVPIAIDHDEDFLRRRHDRKPTKDPCCIIL
ncbi:poly(U)-specific endoribonuclease-B-like [Branchiostoma floridae]|uniref:Uridylate-specific endoribonuclease n=1 Tax=Branchiostoma floridae TaxID=7739 RepID=A0A9J7MQS9_BRAFL|nr:poly(U)-specific endoribonuclease-B-like [Branchiostoma floridae]